MSERIASMVKVAPHPGARIELAAAAVLTAFAIGLVVRHAHAVATAPAKVAIQAEPLAVPAPVAGSDDDAVVDFMEKFALSRVAVTVQEPEASRTEPFAAPVVAAAAGLAATAAPKAPPQRERVRPVSKAVPMPVARPATERRPGAEIEPRRLQTAAQVRSSRIPILSSIAEVMPSSREISRGVNKSMTALQSGVTSIGRKVGSIFSRG